MNPLRMRAVAARIGLLLYLSAFRNSRRSIRALTRKRSRP